MELLMRPIGYAGLDEVSHLEVIFYFHLHADEPMELGARRPRGRCVWPAVGIFAQHGRMRPNRMGVSVCRLLRIRGLRIEVEGLDAVDGTPLLDIKPCLRRCLAFENLCNRVHIVSATVSC